MFQTYAETSHKFSVLKLEKVMEVPDGSWERGEFVGAEEQGVKVLQSLDLRWQTVQLVLLQVQHSQSAQVTQSLRHLPYLVIAKNTRTVLIRGSLIAPKMWFHIIRWRLLFFIIE